MAKTAVLAAVGDELLSGVRREGNCAWLAWLLHDAGWKVLRIEIVPDDLPQIIGLLERWAGKSDLLVLSGGLGPTHDDKTRYALAEYLGCGLSVDDVLYDRVAARYAGTALEAPVERSRPVQGLIPVDARAVYNPAGSALGIRFERAGTGVWSFPGVPFEFKAMAKQELEPILSRERDGRSWTWASVSIVGVPESVAAERISDIIADGRLHVSILPSFGLVEFVVRGEASLVHASTREMRGRFAGDVLPEGCATLPDAILKTGRGRNLTLSCAESCTGGMVGAKLTDLAGSSSVFMGGAVVYSNGSKKNVLGVDESILARHGAVSGECAEAMAKGALRLYGTSLAIAVTGVAGPGGGSAEKPVGTVWFALAWQAGEKVESRSFSQRLGRERALIRERAVHAALAAAWGQMNVLAGLRHDASAPE